MDKPFLIIFFGDIGTGKTTAARLVAEKFGIFQIPFDEVVWLVTKKKEIYGQDGTFLLDLPEIQKVYDQMHFIAEFLLSKGKGVILESMYFSEQRRQAVRVGELLKVSVLLVEFVANEKVVKERLGKRKMKNPQTPGVSLYHKWKGQLGTEEKEHLNLDTSFLTPDQAATAVIKYLTERKVI